MYGIRFAKDVERDLKKIPSFYRNRIFDTIKKQLSFKPSTPTKNRKILINILPPWDAIPPIWELRIGKYRVFYDVDENKKIVYIRAVREKPHGKLTEDIL